MDPTQLSNEVNTFLSQLAAWAAVALPQLVSAIVLLLVGLWFAGWADRSVRRLLGNRVEPTLCGVLASIARYGILVLVLVAVLGQIGIQTTSILAALGAAGLAIGLAMQGTLSNIAAGMMLLWLRPFRVGDYIDTGSVAGTVKELGLFASELHTWDGVFLFVPNSQLWNTRVLNYSRLPTRMVDLKFGVAYGDDLVKGQQVLLHLVTGDTRIRADTAPIVFVNSLGDSAVELALRFWVVNGDYWTLRREMTERGKHALEAAGLSIPFPQRDVRITPSGNGAQMQLAQSS
jgi:small conductance mechanosensitive channel